MLNFALEVKSYTLFMSFLTVGSFSHKRFKVHLTLASQQTFAGFQHVFNTSFAQQFFVFQDVLKTY